MDIFLGIDIGGTKCAVVVGKPENNEISILDKEVITTENAVEPVHFIDRLMRSADMLIQENVTKNGTLKGIGISCGGPLDSSCGTILSPPNLPGWDNIPIVSIFEKRYGVRAKLENDANACALAEWRYGAAKGYHNVVFLTFGTGMGAGLILNGSIYRGASDMAGEIGHIRMERYGPVGYGKTGSFEAFCSGSGIAQLGRAKALEVIQQGKDTVFGISARTPGDIDARVIGDAAERGNDTAKEIYEICGHYLGMGLSIIIDILNPEIIVLGSIFSRSRKLIWPSAEKTIRNESLSRSFAACRIVPAALGEQIGDYAALTVALMDIEEANNER